MNSVTPPPSYQLSQLTGFMKGEPKALGTVQIMIGVWTFLFGIILSTFSLTPGIISGITLWGSLIVKAALGMNVVSAVAAAIAVILFVVDMIYGSISIPWCRYYSYSYNRNYHCNYSTIHLWNGIYGVLFVFSLVEFIISTCTSGFACKATCCTETTVVYSQPMYSQPINPHPMRPQPMNPYPMNPHPMNPQLMNPQLMNPQPMYNPAFYNPLAPQESTLATYNKV